MHSSHDWKRAVLLLLAAAVLAAYFLTACQGSAGGYFRAGRQAQPGQGGQKEAITVWAWDENYNIAAVKEAARRYRQKHPQAEFDIVCMTQEEIMARLRTAVFTGSHKSLPDIVLIEDYSVQYFLQNYRNEFLPLDSIVSKDDFAPCRTGVSQAGGSIYGLPFDNGTIGLFYRLDIIRQAGFTEQDMRCLTWERFLHIAKKVKEKTGKFMLSMNPSDLPLIRMMLQSAGSWYTDEHGQLNLADNPVMAEAVRLYKEMAESGIAMTIADWNQFVHGYWEGRTAAVLTGAWISASIAKQSSQSGLWRMAEVPRMENCPESVNASCIGGSSWYVLRYAGAPQQSVQFLKETFASDTGLMDVLADSIHLLSAHRAFQESESYQKGHPFYGGQIIYQDLISWTNKIPEVNYGADTYRAEAIVAQALQEILKGGDIAGALETYQEKYG